MIYAVIIVVTVSLAVVLATAVQLGSSFTSSDQLSAINDIFAGAALLLAVTAGLIALQAHAAATGRPDVRVQVWLGADQPNRLILAAEQEANGRLRSLAVGNQARINVRLENRSDYSADGLMVSVHFHGIAFDRDFDARVNDWRIVDAIPTRGATAAEWFGGSALHGHTSRRLPELDARSLVQLSGGGDCSVEVIVASNDYLRRVVIPLRFVNVGQPAPAGPPRDDLPAWM